MIHRRGSSDSTELDRLAVRVRAPARLHLGFVDVSGSLGRRFGSLGLALDDFSTDVELRRSDHIAARGEGGDRALDYLRRLVDRYDVKGGTAVTVRRAIPAHVGLGSGTQLALAVGAAFGELHAVQVTLPALAALADRGARSGVGIGAFEHGGFIVDGGRGRGDGHPPVITRLDFPPTWRVLLVFDRAGRGLSGEAEIAAFRALDAFPQASAARLAHLVLLRLLPALAEQEYAAFGDAVGELQRTVGDYFAAVQGGRFSSSAVAEVLAWLEANGVDGVGQSSWGPTGFGIVDSELRAHALLVEARNRFAHRAELDLVVARGRNHGHEIERSTVETLAGAAGIRRSQT